MSAASRPSCRRSASLASRWASRTRDSRCGAPGGHGAEDAGRSWRHVHLHRDHHQISLVIDGRSVPSSVQTDAASTWLTIEPPAEGPVEFRNLVVTW